MSRILYQGRVLHLIEEEVKLPTGQEMTLEIFHHPGAAAIAVYHEEQFFLIRQFRHAAGGFLWEIPAGTLEKSETPLQCAHRELREEAGFLASEMRPLGKTFTVPGFCTECIYLFLATHIQVTTAAPDSDEAIVEVRGFSPSQIMKMIRKGEIIDAKSQVALFHAFSVLNLPIDVDDDGILKSEH
jgi:ADP-ribose pyrophosphatase